MKKIIIGIIILVVFLSLCACGQDNYNNGTRNEHANEPGNGQYNNIVNDSERASYARNANDDEITTITYTRISASDARNMMAELDDFILLDVRTAQEFSQGHIEGAILIPEDVLRLRAGDELSSKDAIIFVYCRSGRRSASAARTLVDLGYTNVYDFGGIEDWPYDVVV